MTVTNLLNTAGWAGAYGMSLYGAGTAVKAFASATAEVFNVGYRFATTQQLYVRKVDVIRNGNAVGDGNNGNIVIKENVFKRDARDFLRGISWVISGLLVRQIVARAFSPTPPDFVVKGLTNLGWQHVPSPVVISIHQRVAPYLPFAFNIV